MSPSIEILIEHAQAQLSDTSPTPRLDAEILLGYVLGASRSRLMAHPEQNVEHHGQQAFAQLIARRRTGEPVAYLTGEREFWSLPLKVTPATLIPRTETELLVEQGLQLVPGSARAHILELGTGSGAVALALAKERPNCAVTATDSSESALAVARQNADALGIHNVDFLCGDWFAPIPDRRFRLILSNPPYVAEDDPHLRNADLRYEPVQALVSGPDGLTAIRTIIRHARGYLEQNGTLLLEHGQGQTEPVRHLMQASGFRDVNSVRDLAGIERVCVGTLGV